MDRDERNQCKFENTNEFLMKQFFDRLQDWMMGNNEKRKPSIESPLHDLELSNYRATMNRNEIHSKQSIDDIEESYMPNTSNKSLDILEFRSQRPKTRFYKQNLTIMPRHRLNDVEMIKPVYSNDITLNKISIMDNTGNGHQVNNISGDEFN